MQGRGRASSLGPRPPYHPGMQQGGWSQPQQQQQPPYFDSQGSYPQQYALVPINGPGMLNGQHGPAVTVQGPQGFAVQPGMPPPQMASQHQFSAGFHNFNGGVAVMPVGGPFLGAPPPGRGGPRPPPGHPPGWSQGRGPGRGGRGRGGPPSGPSTPMGRGPSPGRGRGGPGRGTPQHQGGRGGGTPLSGGSKEDRRNAKAMAKLDKQVQAEKPRVYKALGAEDSQEAARWQAERRKHYPTAANQERKAKAVTDRQARGELEPDQALRRQRLQEVLMRQRELGLSQLAGTQDMQIDGTPSFASPSKGGRGRGGRGGRSDRGGKSDRGGRGRTPFGRGPGRGSPMMPPAMPSGTKRPFSNATADGMTNGQEAEKRAKTEADGLAALMQYGSDEEEDGPAEAAQEGAGAAAQVEAAAASMPQTDEEKQALYVKHKEQVERQQQQHLAKVERKKMQQEQWASQGRGRGRGARGGRGGRNSNAQQAQQAQRAQRQPTLLQKLLVKDIRKDHSHILQCFRFFVDNDFLQDVGCKPLVFPEPPPTLRDILPSMPDEREVLGSDASDSDNDEAPADNAAAVNGQAAVGEEDEDVESEADVEAEQQD